MISRQYTEARRFPALVIQLDRHPYRIPAHCIMRSDSKLMLPSSYADSEIRQSTYKPEGSHWQATGLLVALKRHRRYEFLKETAAREEYETFENAIEMDDPQARKHSSLPGDDRCRPLNWADDVLRFVVDDSGQPQHLPQAASVCGQACHCDRRRGRPCISAQSCTTSCAQRHPRGSCRPHFPASHPYLPGQTNTLMDDDGIPRLYDYGIIELRENVGAEAPGEMGWMRWTAPERLDPLHFGIEKVRSGNPSGRCVLIRHADIRDGATCHSTGMGRGLSYESGG